MQANTPVTVIEADPSTLSIHERPTLQTPVCPVLSAPVTTQPHPDDLSDRAGAYYIATSILCAGALVLAMFIGCYRMGQRDGMRMAAPTYDASTGQVR